MSESDILISIVYGLVGATGALSVVLFAWGLIEYLTKIGLPSGQRDYGISIMEWAVRLIITSVVLITVLKYLELWFA